QQTGLAPSIYNIRYVKPLDTDLVDEAAAECACIITVEDGCVAGGLFGAVSEYLAGRRNRPSVVPVGIPDVFVSQGTQSELRADFGLDSDSLLKIILKEFAKIEQKVLQN
ncbi:MAG: hypothetical protein NC308_02075, partial [Clostridium sp.]|nr:hypothetical protein [Clostridium sp.]